MNDNLLYKIYWKLKLTEKIFLWDGQQRGFFMKFHAPALRKTSS
ncbi:Uncharacterized protein dnm_057480 [Desulfonema magnum]|uniref:Uncharacterized protein n=1 Tax=Desulfonema magnum TaxID=45655 RepID=A0A975BQB5_9BACT|nr:Uncharacterized protein dnm_057480 [Desulfonema magnum]